MRDAPTRPSPHRKRCKRFNEPGHAHALTFSCFKRQPFLKSDRTRRWVIDAIDAARAKHHFEVWAFVVMPEHVHVLLCPRRPHYSISGILASIKLPVTRRTARYVRESAPGFLERMSDVQPGGM